MLRAVLAALLLTAAPALAHEGEGQIQIHGAFALAATPQATTGTAYMMIHNHANADDRLLSASSPAAERVEIHESREDASGVMRMDAVEGGAEVPRGGVLMLQRGGVHLMFLGLTQPWNDGDAIPVTLTFEKAGEVEAEIPVDLSRLADPAGDSMEGMDHGSMEGMDMDGEGS